MRPREQVAHALLDIDSILLDTHNPFTFSSGLLSPVYINHRALTYYPIKWRTVLNCFKHIVENLQVEFDVIAGVETSGISHSAALGVLLGKPVVFVRKKPRTHGTKGRVEGGPVANRRVLLIEDLISTGGSCISAANALKEEGGHVSACVAIINYELPGTVQEFIKSDAVLHTLVSFSLILEIVKGEGLITQNDYKDVRRWLNNPYEWSKQV